MGEQGMVERAKVAALMAYMEHGGRADIAENLTHGDGRFTPPNAIDAMIRAAIKAMREPSFPMIQAMFNTKDDGGGNLHERKWQAAIDAALQGEG